MKKKIKTDFVIDRSKPDLFSTVMDYIFFTGVYLFFGGVGILMLLSMALLIKIKLIALFL